MAKGNGSTDKATGELLQLITFGMGTEWYALEASNVRSIEAEAEITPVPCAPEWLLGVFNYHGTILPIVDLRPLLQSSRQEKSNRGLFLIFHWDDNDAAIWVDIVDEIYEVQPSSIEPQAVTPEGEKAELLLGRVRVRDRLIGVIDTETLMRILIEG